MWIEVVLFPSQVKQVDNSSCRTQQDERTPRAKLFVRNLSLLFIADGSSVCSEMPPIKLNTQYKIPIFIYSVYTYIYDVLDCKQHLLLFISPVMGLGTCGSMNIAVKYTFYFAQILKYS